MKRILLILVFACASHIMFADELPEEREERIKEMAQEGYGLIDTIFERAQVSVAAKEDLMNAQWFGKQKEVKELQNLLSNATIIFNFDENTENPIPKKLATYIENKIKDEIPHIFAIDSISINRVEDFYQFSHTICKLSGGSHCGRMMRTIESDNFDKMLKLRLQKMAREQLRKEIAEQLRDVLLFGGYR